VTDASHAAGGTTAGAATGRLIGGGAVIAGEVRFARSFWQRFRGLMGRARLAEGEALWLPDTSIHMFFMRFPIDAIFLSAPDPSTERTIIACRPSLKPWVGLVMPVKGAEGVVELADGTIGRTGIQVGDKLTLEEPRA
jgi:uncharacterized membrane protein (UPF0127 family)